MQVYVLASSSKGNASVLEIAGHYFLIDAGIPCALLEKQLALCGLHPSCLSAVFITHEHQDHIKGLDVLVHRYRLPVFTRPGTWEKLSFKKPVPAGCRREIQESLTLEGVSIHTFPISHDAADPVGFSFHGEGRTFTAATDLGIITPSVENAVREADVLLLESNHDPQMLLHGTYPAFLKKRMAGENGHVSIQEAGRLLAENSMGRPRQVFLAHLSSENNRIETAQQCVRNLLEEAGYQMGRDITLHKTYPQQVSHISLNRESLYKK